MSGGVSLVRRLSLRPVRTPINRFAADSLQEEDGFEPPVPLESNTSVSTGFGGGAQQHVWLERQHDAIGLVAQA